MILGGEKAPHHGWSLLRRTVTSFPSSHAFLKRTRELFKEIRDAKGTFHAKMGSIKDRNGRDLRKAEDIKKRGKNTQKNCTKKIFMTQITMMV